MIRVIRKHNETLQFCMMQDKHLLEQAVVFHSHDHAVDYLRSFLTDSDNAFILRKILQEAAPWQFNLPSLSDHQVLAHVARMVVQGLVVVGRGKQEKIVGGTSHYVEKVVEEGKKRSKKKYVEIFLEENKITAVPSVAAFSKESKSTPEPVVESELHWIAVRVVDDNDLPISDKFVRLHTTDGQTVEKVLGPDGLVQADEIPEGVCKFVLPVKDRAEWIDPNAPPPPEDPKEIPEGHWIVRKKIKPPGPEVPNLVTDEQHKVIIGRKIVEQLEIDEALFRLMSTVLLPEAQEPDSAPTEPDGTRPTSMDLLAASLRYAELHPDRKILVTGHTDTSGGDEYNQDISEYRARAVYAVLANEETSREDFGKVCHGPHLQTKEKKQQVLYNDRIQVLNWVAETFGWPCSTNGEFGNYLKAVKAFQSTYNTEGNEKKPKEQLAVDGDFGPACWRAVFDCYQVHLAETLECTTEELQALQDQIRPRFLKEYVGCGENKPKEMVGVDNYRSQTNRRVEVLFFKADDHVPETPCLVGDCNPEECELYDRAWYLRKRLPVKTVEGKSVKLLRVRFLDQDYQLYSQLRYTAQSDNYFLSQGILPDDGILQLDIPETTKSIVVSLYLSEEEPAEQLDFKFDIRHDPFTDSLPDKAQRVVNLGFADELPPGEEKNKALRLGLAKHRSTMGNKTEDDENTIRSAVAQHDGIEPLPKAAPC